MSLFGDPVDNAITAAAKKSTTDAYAKLTAAVINALKEDSTLFWTASVTPDNQIVASEMPLKNGKIAWLCYTSKKHVAAVEHIINKPVISVTYRTLFYQAVTNPNFGAIIFNYDMGDQALTLDKAHIIKIVQQAGAK